MSFRAELQSFYEKLNSSKAVDRKTGLKSFAEFVTNHASDIQKIPDEIPMIFDNTKYAITTEIEKSKSKSTDLIQKYFCSPFKDIMIILLGYSDPVAQCMISTDTTCEILDYFLEILKNDKFAAVLEAFGQTIRLLFCHLMGNINLASAMTPKIFSSLLVFLIFSISQIFYRDIGIRDWKG
jgi:hypothetical protein